MPTVGDDVPVTGVDKLDLLFVIDNSSSMQEEQAKLAQQLPRLLAALTSGTSESGLNFSPVKDMRVGVVTTDMGLNGSKIALPNCEGFGDDGVLVKNHASCAAPYPAGYLRYQAGDVGSENSLQDTGCLVQVGNDGCGWEQQLEAMYKTLAPKSATVFAGGTGGHASDENKGFLRPEAVLAVVHLSDDDDCSTTDEGQVMFDANANAPGVRLPGSDKNLGLNLRCAFSPDSESRKSQAEDEGYLYDTDRFITDFKKTVKPLNPDRIVFAAIVGIPEQSEGKAFDDILASPRLSFAIDPATGSGDPTNANTLPRATCRRCATVNEADCFAQPILTTEGVPNPELVTSAMPAVRFVKTAQGFGQNAYLGSICAESYAPAIDAITEKIARQMTGPCLPRELETDDDGSVDCDIVEILPPSGVATDCSAERGRKFLELRTFGGEQRATCIINQVAVNDGKLVAGPHPLSGVEPLVGWFYDTFSERVKAECPIDRQRRIGFTQGAEPNQAILRIECPSRRGMLCGSEP